MKRKVKIFIYALVAWFVGMAVIVYDFAVSYAASFNDVADAEWKYIVGGYVNDITKNTGIEDMPFEIPEGRPSTCPGLSKSTKYEENFAYSQPGSYYGGCNYTIGSDSEIVLFLTWSNTESDNAVFNKYRAASLQQYSYQVGSMLSFYISKTDITAKGQGYIYRSGWVEESAYSRSEVTCRKNDLLKDYAVYSFFCGTNGGGAAMKTGKVKVFTTAEGVMNYLENGDTSGMAWNGAAPEYDGENIYLNDFQMIVHDSNAYSAYYLEFKYTIPEQLRDAQSLKLQIEEQYDWTITGLSSLVTYPRTFSGNDYVDVLQYPTGFKLYLDDINAIAQSITDIPIASTVSRRAVIGSELAFDTSGVSISGLGGETVVKVTNSKLYLTCYVVANNKYGVNYSGSVDFVSGSNDMSSYTPDSSGNYKYNGDFKNQGHYFTDVSTDAAGNTTYNYYYYGTDNSRTEITAKDSTDGTVTVVPGPSGSIINNITMPDHIFVSVSGSTGSSGGSSGSGSDVGNVTIEDDDLSFDSLRQSIKDGYGLIDDTDTGEKGDGLVAMMSDLFGYLPASFTRLIMLGMSSVVGIAILRMICKR